MRTNKTPNSSRLRYGAFLLLALLVGLLLEYKLNLVDQIQDYRNQPDQLPSLPLDQKPSAANNVIAGLTTHAASGMSAEEWLNWRSSQRQFVMGSFSTPLIPKRDVIYKVLNEKQVGEVKQLLIAFDSFDGQQIPAYINIPVRRKKAPGVIVVPGHVREGQSGIEQLINGPESYQHAAAMRLAKAGFVTLSFELRGFGYLGVPEHPEHKIVAYNALLSGLTYKELILQDTAIAVSILEGMEQVEPNRIGIAGASYGGEIAVQYAALDDRISAVVFHSYGGGSGSKKPVNRANTKLPHYCHILPGIDNVIKQEHWLWMLAPRPVLGVRGKSNEKGFLSRMELYGLGWGKERDIELKVEPEGHEFFVGPTISFFKKHL